MYYESSDADLVYVSLLGKSLLHACIPHRGMTSVVDERGAHNISSASHTFRKNKLV